MQLTYTAGEAQRWGLVCPVVRVKRTTTTRFSLMFSQRSNLKECKAKPLPAPFLPPSADPETFAENLNWRSDYPHTSLCLQRKATRISENEKPPLGSLKCDTLQASARVLIHSSEVKESPTVNLFLQSQVDLASFAILGPRPAWPHQHSTPQ